MYDHMKNKKEHLIKQRYI